MNTMSQAAIDAFLQQPRHAVAGTNRQSGAPQLSPVWYFYADGRFYISINAGTAKHHNLQRDPHISLCIDGGYPDYRTVIVYGTATLIPAPDPRVEELRWRIIQRYHEDESEARRYAESTRDQSHVLVMVTPEKVLSQDFN